VRTGRRDALAGTSQHPDGMSFLIVLFPSIAGIFDHFSGQRTLDENRLAVNMCDASPFVVQGFNVCKRHGKWQTRSARGRDYNRHMKPCLAAQPGSEAAKRSFLNS
jgi:hypothetical protein